MAGTFCVQTYKIRKNEKIEDFFEKVVDIAETMSYKPPCRCGGNVDENESHKGVASYRTE